MTFSSLRTPARPLLVAALVLLAAAEVAAQTRGGTGTRSTAPTRSTSGGSGSGGFSGGSGGQMGNRQYPNATQVGDAMITSDLETRRLIVVTDDETNENIKTVIAQLDKPKPQVLINVVFVQVSHDNDLDLGAEGTFTEKAGLKNGPTGTTTTRFGVADQLADPTAYGAFYKLSGIHDLNLTLHALAGVAKTEILSRPSILTRSSQQATILVGQSVPIITNSRVSDTTNTTINTVQYEDVGIILRVTPYITQEGMVEMIVSPEISSLSATTVPISNNVSSPVIDRRAADTVVVTPSDQTVVIGGLISTQKDNTEKKVPLLGDIPILGYAFKRHQKKDTKTELLIFLTPHVVQNPSDLGHLAKEEREKLDLAPKSFQRQEMDRYIGPK
jgi:general secretion pathway protein D